MPLIITLRTILIAAAAPISAPATLARIPRLASIAHRISRGRGTRHPARIGGAPQLTAGALRKKNIPGGHHRRVGVMQSGGNRLARLAKADEGDPRFGVGHAFLSRP